MRFGVVILSGYTLLAGCSSPSQDDGIIGSDSDPTTPPSSSTVAPPASSSTGSPDTASSDRPIEPVGTHAVDVAKATWIPVCSAFVDVAAAGKGTGTAADPFQQIAPAILAIKAGGSICVAEGTYTEKVTPGAKSFLLYGGFQHGKGFTVRDSSVYVSKAQGDGKGSFISVTDDAPMEGQLTKIDGFEITRFSQAVVRDSYVSQQFELTNNYIHDNTCSGTAAFAGAAFSLNNISGRISRNVIKNNSCPRGGGGVLNDTTNKNSIRLENNLVDGNSGTEPQISHGGGFYLFGHTLTVVGNEFRNNSATGYGAGLFLGANTGGGQRTTATISWNFYHDNKAGIAGGGLFCDDSANCLSNHEIYSKNCGGNMYFDSGPTGAEATIGRVDHVTNVNALEVGCAAPGAGVVITKDNAAADDYSFTNSIFAGNAKDRDLDASCENGCTAVKVRVSYSQVQTTYANGGVAVTFGTGNMTVADPMFVDGAKADFHLRSTRGHWTPNGVAMGDAADSPVLSKGDPTSPIDQNPPSAGQRVELGAYGNSPEASYVR